jgi:hypothetical protein
MVAAVAPLAKEHQMLRSLSVAFALIAFASLAAQAAPYRDPSGRFTVTVPEGWTAQDVGDPRIAVLISAPGADEFSGLCMVSVKESPELRSLTQVQIDEVFATGINREFWEAAYQSANVKDVAVEDSGTREQNGHKAYYALASATVTLAAGPVRAKSKIQLQVIPGSFHGVNCRATAETFASYAAQFETVFSSHEPKGGGYIASAPRNGGPATLGFNPGRRDPRATLNAAWTMVSEQLKASAAMRRR